MFLSAKDTAFQLQRYVDDDTWECMTLIMGTRRNQQCILCVEFQVIERESGWLHTYRGALKSRK